MTFYNPHVLDRDRLVESFVARTDVLDALVDDLRRGGKQHHLLIGERGAGKTTLLLRLAVAIEDDAKLAKKFVALRFPEEQYNVARLSDFWMNAIDSLIDVVEQSDRAAATRLEASRDALDAGDEETRAKAALDLLLGWIKKAKRGVVLLVDNLDLVLERIKDAQWALREALSEENRITLVGASSKFLGEATNYKAPFYDFFHVHELGPLPEAEARALVIALARRAKSPVEAVLQNDAGRFKALYILSGGAPRTLALLHTVLAIEGDSVEQDLDRLLDQVTPYYKARFEELPAQSQVIVDKVALHWNPITAAEVQAVTHLEINVVSAQLSRLAKMGVLAKVDLPEGRRLGFQLSERFFNIWYLMRASRRLRKRLQWFVECIRIVFDEQVLRERAEKLLAARSLDSPDKLLAYASAIDDRNLRCRLENKAVVEIIRSGADPSVQLDLENEDKHLEPIVDRARAMHELRRGGKRAMELARSYLVPLEVKTRLMRSGSSKPFPPGTILEMLSDAVEAGVVPSLPDIRRGEELSQILTIVPGTYHAAVFVIVAGWFLPYGDIPPGVVDVAEPSCATAMVLASGVMGWSTPENAARARILFHRALELDSSAALTSFVDVCTQMPRAHVRDLHRALEDEGLVEAWAPLYEALRSIAEPDRLDALAPEMRAAAKAIAATFKPA